MVSGLRDKLAIEFISFFAAVEGGGWFMIADFRGEGGAFFSADVGRVGDDEIEER